MLTYRRLAAGLVVGLMSLCVALGADLVKEVDERSAVKRVDALLVTRVEIASGKATYKFFTEASLLKQWAELMGRVGEGSGVEITPAPSVEQVNILAFAGAEMQRYAVLGESMLVSSDVGLCAVVGPSGELQEVLPKRTLELESDWAMLVARLLGK